MIASNTKSYQDAVCNWVRAELLGADLKLRVYFTIGEAPLYQSYKKEVQIPLEKLMSKSPTDCAIIFHEMAHAWQHQYLKIFMLLFGSMYWTRLCLEAHASRLALKWMKKYFTSDQITEAKRELNNSLKTYL